jgi:threonyl-tRNA synthetase
VGTVENWKLSEQALREVLSEEGFDFIEAENEAAFYGPKIDFIVRDVIGRDWQLGTVQVDYNLPERFDLTYIGADGKEHRPYMVHRALLGSIERFFGILIEHYAGAFPLWLAPEQVRILPITDKQLEYAKNIQASLRAAGFRCEIDTSSEKLGAKIRSGTMMKVPYMVIVGGKDEAAGVVSVRSRAEGDKGQMKLDELISALSAEREG